MQTFSNMRRNSTYKQTLISILLFVGFYVYESVASMQMWLPPFIGVCLSLFMRFDKQDNFYGFLAVVLGVILIEAENNLPMGMLLGLFLFLSFLVIPRIQAVLDTPRIARAIYVVLAYVGFYFLALMIDGLMGSSIAPNMWIVLYYMFIEIIVVMFV